MWKPICQESPRSSTLEVTVRTRARTTASPVWVRSRTRVSPSGLILLSPGAPSFGEFRDFEERGQRFTALCEEFAGRAEASG